MNRTMGQVAVFAFFAILALISILSSDRHIELVSKRPAHFSPSFYIAEVPDKFTNGINGKGRAETDSHYGFAALGPLLSAEHDHWDTIWHRVVGWYINQLSTSFLRTYDVDAADIIFVPATISKANKSLQTDFFEEASTFLPYLGQKPHVVVLSHSPLWYYSEMTDNANFTFVSWGQLNKSNPYVVGSPAFSHVHWSRGSQKIEFDSNQTIQAKKILAFGSFLVRSFPDRYAAHDNCLGKPDLCKFMVYNGPQDLVAIYEGYKSAWYALHPRGDFLSRNSWFDTWLADTIPVVFQPEYIDSVPFGDVIDYTKLMLYIPEERFVSNGLNIVEMIEGLFDREKAVQQIQEIHRVRHVFQYMLNPAHELIRWDQRAYMHSDDDAFTFTMKSVLRNICSRGWCSRHCS